MGVFAPWIISLAATHRFKEKVENIAFISIAAISAMIYFCALAHLLIPGVVIACVMIIVCIVYCFYAAIKDRAGFRETLFSPGSVLLLCFIIFFGITGIGRSFFHNDDLHQFGLGLKYIYYYQDIYAKGRIYHHMHPIGVLLWDYFCTRTYPRFSEGILMWAQNILLVSVLFPLVNFVRDGHKAIKGAILSIIILLLPISMINYVYASLLMDSIMSFVFAYLLIAVALFYTEHKTIYFWQILAGLYILVSTKRFSIIPAAIILFIITFFFFQHRDSVGASARRWGLFVGSYVIVCVTYFSWSVFIEHQWGMSVAFPVVALVGGALLSYLYDKRRFFIRHETASVIGIVAIVAIFGFTFAKVALVGNEYNKAVARLFWEYLITVDENGSGEVSFIGNIVQLPWLYFVLIVLIVALAFMFIYYRGNISACARKLKDHSVMLQTMVLAAIGFAGYLMVLLVTYMYQIPNWMDGDTPIHLPAFYRYMLPCYYCVVLCGLYVLLKGVYKRGLYVYILALTLVFTISDVGNIVNYISDKHEAIHFYGFENAGITLTSDDYIYYIDERPISNEYSEYFRYIAFPAPAYVNNEMFHTENFTSDEDYISRDKFVWWLEEDDFTYVYIQTIDDKFIDMYGDLFEDISRIGNVYSVEHDENGELYLHLCDP